MSTQVKSEPTESYITVKKSDLLKAVAFEIRENYWAGQAVGVLTASDIALRVLERLRGNPRRTE